MLNQILLQLLNGLVVGSSLALVAAGLALLFGVLHIINFAQGDFFMMGGYAVWFSLNLTHNYVLAMLLGTVLVAIGGGLLLTAVIWPLLQRSQVLVLLATLGLSLILQQLATNILGGDTKLVPPPLSVAVPMWNSPIQGFAFDQIQKALEAIMYKTAKPKAALASAQHACQSQLQRTLKSGGH